MSKKILFITTRNIFTTSGEFRLIKNRTRVFYEKWNISTDFIAISREERIKSSNENIGYESTTYPIPVKKLHPVSILKAFKKTEEQIIETLRKEQYSAIILSGIGTHSFNSFLTKNNINIPVIADMHGAKDELIEFNDGNFLKRIYKKILYGYRKYSENKYLNKLDG